MFLTSKKGVTVLGKNTVLIEESKLSPIIVSFPLASSYKAEVAKGAFTNKVKRLARDKQKSK